MNMLEKRKNICTIVFIIYMLTVLNLTIIRPGFFYNERQLNLDLFSNLIGIYYSAGIRRFLRLFLGNIGWFVPFGFILPILSAKKSFVITTVFGALFSFYIEAVQFIFYKGVAELDDLILNTFGTIIGYLLYRIMKSMLAVKAA